MFYRKPSDDPMSMQASSATPHSNGEHSATSIAVPKQKVAPRPAPAQPSQHEEGLVVIGKGSRIGGSIGDCRILDVHGVIEADVSAETLIVRNGGGIRGTIQADNAEVHGVVEGVFQVRGHLEIANSGDVSGEVFYGTISVATGGSLRGNIESGGQSESAAEDVSAQNQNFYEHDFQAPANGAAHTSIVLEAANADDAAGVGTKSSTVVLDPDDVPVTH